MKPLRTTFLILWSLLTVNSSYGQEEPPAEKTFKNVVRYNISSPALFGFETLIMGYERAVGKHQSFSVNLGQIAFPSFSIVSGSIQSTKQSRQTGYNISGDYRFYLPKENKHNAPHGVYLAPYASYTYFERTNTWTVDFDSFDGEVSTDFSLAITTLGGELGYQFIIWKRLAIDLILIGPGVSAYSIETKLSTTLDANEESELFKALNDALAEKIPGYELVIQPGEFEKEGSVSTTSIGFRYLIHIGFAF